MTMAENKPKQRVKIYSMGLGASHIIPVYELDKDAGGNILREKSTGVATCKQAGGVKINSVGTVETGVTKVSAHNLKNLQDGTSLASAGSVTMLEVSFDSYGGKRGWVLVDHTRLIP